MADQIVLNHVTKRFTTKTLGDIVAVDDFNLSVHEGECFSFLGPSGCGKSTAMYSIAGLLEPYQGEIYFGDTKMTAKMDTYAPRSSKSAIRKR